MKREEFYGFIERHILDSLPDKYAGATAHLQDIEKIASSYKGLIIDLNNPGLKIAPTINLDNLYDRYPDEYEALDACVEAFEEAMITASEPEMVEAASKLSDYSYVGNNLIMAAIPPSAKDSLSDIPHQEIQGITFVARMLVTKTEESMASAVVHYSHMESWGVDEETLFADAWRGTREHMPGTVIPMAEILRGLIPEPELEMGQDFFMGVPPIYVYTNESRIQGAVSFFCDGVMDQMAEKLGGDYYVIPSSLHEILLVPDDGEKARADELTTMVKEVNGSVVQEDEILFDKAFHYDSKEHLFEEAYAYEKRAGLSAEEEEIDMTPEEDMTLTRDKIISGFVV